MIMMETTAMTDYEDDELIIYVIADDDCDHIIRGLRISDSPRLMQTGKGTAHMQTRPR